MFNRYGEGMAFGAHVDGAVRINPRTGGKLRTDISATLFLSDPDDYDGGELEIVDTYGEHAVKLNAGDLLLYPASSLHQVTQITRGERLACFFWVQSLVRDDGRRSLLYELDTGDTAARRHGGYGRDGAHHPGRLLPQPPAPVGRGLKLWGCLRRRGIVLPATLPICY